VTALYMWLKPSLASLQLSDPPQIRPADRQRLFLQLYDRCWFTQLPKVLALTSISCALNDATVRSQHHWSLF
jgi:hypothetical protein